MSRTIEYVFTIISPWAYLGFDHFHALARRHGAAIHYRPVLLTEVFSETGGLPLARRHPVRQAYRFMELQRWRARRGVELKLRPKCFPFDQTLADRTAIALMEARIPPADYLRAAHRAVFVEERNLADERELAALLNSLGQPISILESAMSDRIGDLYAANRDFALAAGVFGAPSYVLDGEVFWGQDRLELLEDALASGRQPYRPDTDF
jgi:2-hydroxychromene-2-carboxylate isomerase